jgi:glycosyltransferase involved in cell wall biosynthesis
MATELVTVIIPCFNAAGFVGDAIESALSQSWSAIEVVVIDDGSTDDSVGVLRRFGDCVRWETGPNRGACAARNRGLEMARGEWIQFLDADDLLLPSKIERQIKHALGLSQQTMSACLGVSLDGDKFFDWQYSRAYDSASDPLGFVLGGALPTPAILHARQNLSAVGGFDESLPCSQEFDLHLRLVASGLGIAQLPEQLYRVRRQPGSVSSNSLRVLMQRRQILARVKDLLVLKDAMSPERKQALATCMARAALQLQRAGEYAAAEDLLADAGKLAYRPELLAWTPRWRPLVRLLGSARVSRLREALRAVRERRQ